MNAVTDDKNIIDKKNILSEAIDRCLQEMYYHAQPSIDLNNAIKEAKEKREKLDLIDKHYLSKEMYNNIVNKYIDAYHLDNYFQNSLELLLSYFDHPYVKDYSKGYKMHKEIKSLFEKIGKENFEIVKDYIDKAKNYYNRNIDAETFKFNVANFSPTSNKQTVIDYWKSQGKDIEIKDYSSEEVFELVYYGTIMDEDMLFDD